MLSALDICVNKKAPPTDSVHWALNPLPHLKNIITFFCQVPLKSANYLSPPF